MVAMHALGERVFAKQVERNHFLDEPAGPAHHHPSPFDLLTALRRVCRRTPILLRHTATPLRGCSKSKPVRKLAPADQLRTAVIAAVEYNHRLEAIRRIAPNLVGRSLSPTPARRACGSRPGILRRTRWRGLPTRGGEASP